MKITISKKEAREVIEKLNHALTVHRNNVENFCSDIFKEENRANFGSINGDVIFNGTNYNVVKTKIDGEKKIAVVRRPDLSVLNEMHIFLTNEEKEKVEFLICWTRADTVTIDI